MLTATFRNDPFIHAVMLGQLVTKCGQGKKPGWEMHGEEDWIWVVSCPRCVKQLGRA